MAEYYEWIKTSKPRYNIFAWSPNKYKISLIKY